MGREYIKFSHDLRDFLLFFSFSAHKKFHSEFIIDEDDSLHNTLDDLKRNDTFLLLFSDSPAKRRNILRRDDRIKHEIVCDWGEKMRDVRRHAYLHIFAINGWSREKTENTEEKFHLHFACDRFKFLSEVFLCSLKDFIAILLFSLNVF